MDGVGLHSSINARGCAYEQRWNEDRGTRTGDGGCKDHEVGLRARLLRCSRSYFSATRVLFVASWLCDLFRRTARSHTAPRIQRHETFLVE